MNILLMSLNSKYIHTNLAIQSIHAYYKQYSKSQQTIHMQEFTINHDIDTVLRMIVKGEYTHIFASAYIWNIEIMDILFTNLKQLRPQIKIFLGGPEVSYNPKEQLIQKSYLDGILYGEGERIFCNLIDEMIFKGDSNALMNVPGVAYKQGQEIYVNAPMPLIESLDEIPFSYVDLHDFSNRILYYESSRGCPFNCSYCLSSAVEGLRHLSLERVKSDLKFFIKSEVPQVKFVDRTFNAKKEHAIEIIKFLIEQDNGITNFHFEITASLLDLEYMEVLKNARPGLFQFEIGVQTTHQPTMHAIHRPISFDKIKWTCQTLKGFENIHLHLDLIAGLPYEPFDTFLKSFDDVYGLEPDELQLGFLKVLKGTEMAEMVQKHRYIVGVQAPYEVFENQWISMSQMSILKDVEVLLGYYYNSGKFVMSLKYFHKKTEMAASGFFLEMAEYFNQHDYLASPIGTYRLYELIYEFYVHKFGEDHLFKELLKIDYFYAKLKGQKPLFDEREIKSFNQMRLEWLKNPEFTHQYFANNPETQPKERLKTLEFTTLKYDILRLIQSDYQDVCLKEGVIMFDYSNAFKVRMIFIDDMYMTKS